MPSILWLALVQTGARTKEEFSTAQLEMIKPLTLTGIEERDNCASYWIN